MAPFHPRALKRKSGDNAQKSKSKFPPAVRPTRVGFGEYSHPSHYDKAGLYAQLEFIEKIEDLAQEVLVDLAQSVRPKYERVRSVMDQFELLSLDSETLVKLAESGRNEFADLLAALEDWLKRYSLNAEWVRNMVLRTLFEWTGKIVVAPGRRLQFSAPMSAKKSVMAEIPFSFSAYGWRITDETENAFRARATTEFKTYLDGYVGRVSGQAEQAGWIKTPQVRKSRTDTDAFRHFEWLVRWQCQKWTTTEIAKEYGLGNPRKGNSRKRSAENPGERSSYAAESDRRRKAAYRTVRDGLIKAADLLGLPLRPGYAVDENNLSQ